MNGPDGSGIEHRAAHGGRQSAGGNLPTGNRVDQLFFRALGVLGGEHVNQDSRLILSSFLQRLNGLGLVVLNADVAFLQAEDLHNELQAGDHILGLLPAQPVVGSDVRLTLTGVDDDGIHLADAAGQLHMGGEGCAAHTHNAALVDDIHQLFGSQCVHFLLGSGLHRFTQSIQVVIFDDHAQNHAAIGVSPGLHRLDLTGNGSVHRDAQSLVVADLLTLCHQVAFCNQGLTGGADVLRHGNHDNIRFRKSLGFLVTGIPLIFFGMYPAEKRKRHVSSPLSNLRLKPRVSGYIIAHFSRFVHFFIHNSQKNVVQSIYIDTK